MWARHGPQFLQETSTCCGVGSSRHCRVDICSSTVLSVDCRAAPAPLWSSPGAAGECLLRHLLHPSTLSALPSGLFLSHFSSLLTARQHFTLFQIHFPQGTITLATGLGHAMRWGHWSGLEWAVSSTEQPWPLITEVPEASPASIWAPAPCTRF